MSKPFLSTTYISQRAKNKFPTLGNSKSSIYEPGSISRTELGKWEPTNPRSEIKPATTEPASAGKKPRRKFDAPFKAAAVEHCRRHGGDLLQTANPYDNAAVESFFSTLKTECCRQHPLTTPAATKALLFNYIETLYNRTRLHSALGFQSPADFESSTPSPTSLGFPNSVR
jgi:hypothetical protein